MTFPRLERKESPVDQCFLCHSEHDDDDDDGVWYMKMSSFI